MGRNLAVALLVLTRVVQARSVEADWLCPISDPEALHAGAFVGLGTDGVAEFVAADEEAWVVVDPATSDLEELNKSTRSSGQRFHGAQFGPRRFANNSLTGKYLQVVPDDGDSYKVMADGGFPDQEMPWVGFKLWVPAEAAGLHTLFLRWTGGDSFGGGDSLYVAMYEGESGRVVPGPDTYKPTEVPINQNPGQYAGCCYHMTTHACPCFTRPPTAAECPSHEGRDLFQDPESAARFGARCKAGGGQMDVVRAPNWYLFAGQEMGNVMDFDSEPWDATCEAEGQASADSGQDFAQWQLEGGRLYVLRFYPREDGTAFDAFFLAGPATAPPTPATRFHPGNSTTCLTGLLPASPLEEPSRSHGGDSSGGAAVIGMVVTLVGLGALLGGLFLAPQTRTFMLDWGGLLKDKLGLESRFRHIELDGLDDLNDDDRGYAPAELVPLPGQA